MVAGRDAHTPPALGVRGGGGWGARFLLGGPSGQNLRRRHGDPEAHRGELGEPDARGEGGHPAPSPRAPLPRPDGAAQPPSRGPARSRRARGARGGARGVRAAQPRLLTSAPASVRPTELGLQLGLRGQGGPHGLGPRRPPPKPPDPSVAPSERAGALGPGTGAAPAGGGGSCGARWGGGGGACGAPPVEAWGAFILKNKGGR